MAIRPKFIRNKSVMAIAGIVAAALVGYAMWGPVAGALVAVLAIPWVLIYRWRDRAREARVRTTADDFSFAEVAVRMRAKDEAHDLLMAQRATAVREAAATP